MLNRLPAEAGKLTALQIESLAASTLPASLYAPPITPLQGGIFSGARDGADWDGALPELDPCSKDSMSKLGHKSKLSDWTTVS